MFCDLHLAETMAGEVRKSKQTVPILCKLVELCLTIVIVGLIVDPTNSGILQFDQNHSGIVYVTWPGYILINSILLIGYVIGDRIPKRTMMLFSFVGGILYIAAASVAIHDWRQNQITPQGARPSKQYQDMTISAAVLAIFTALIMFLDTAATAFFMEEDDDLD